VSLKHKAIQGGAFLVARQAIGIALSLVGVLLVTRIIGPRQYGLYAVGAGVVNYLYTFGTWGLDVYLLRKTEDPHGREFDQAFTILLCVSAIFTVGLIALARIIAGFVRIAGVAPLISVLTIGIPLNLLVLPATVKLDRELNFKQVAMIELIGQVSLYAVSVPLAFAGAGAWAPVGGFLTQEFLILVLTFWKSACAAMGYGFDPPDAELRTRLFQFCLGLAASELGESLNCRAVCRDRSSGLCRGRHPVRRSPLICEGRDLADCDGRAG
jgi:O-antigen/teichoic acid export membrane protein